MICWDAIRAEFPALASWTYLNTATFGQLPRRAVDAVSRHFAHRDELACSDFLDWFTDHDHLRERLAEMIHAAPEDIAFAPHAAGALSLLVNGIDWRAGDRVVTFRNEFPNLLYAAAGAQAAGVEAVETTWPEFYDAVTPTTRLVALSTVNYTNGFRPPLEEIARFLAERNIPFYVDGTQSLGALPFDASAIRPAVFAVHAYKWMLSPNGAAFFYVRPDVRAWLAPDVIGWRSDRGWREVNHLHHGAPRLKESAEKYEGAMLQSALLYAMAASVDLMLDIGQQAIEERVRELAGYTRKRLRELGARLLYDEEPYFDSPIIAARFEGRDAGALAAGLKERRVVVSARHGNLRISTHFYNNESDVDELCRALRRLL